MSISIEAANRVVDYANAHGVSHAEAAEALGLTVLGLNDKPASPDPWGKFRKADDRIPAQKVADHLMREDGIPEARALKMAMHMDADSAKPLLDAEEKRYNERAEAAAREEWSHTAEGIAAMGRIRQAQASAVREQADAMRPELEARGLPVETMSDTEVVGFVKEVEERRALDAQANDLQANIDAALGGGDE